MRRVLAVAHFTFLGLIRSRLLAVWALSVAVLCALSFLLSMLSYGEILRIFMDLGLAGMEATGVVVLLLSLAVSYTSEMEQKGIFLQVTKPLTRGEYLLGRILGFFAVNSVVLLGMALLVAGVTLLFGGTVPKLFLSAVLLILLEYFTLTVVGLSYQMVATSMVGTVLFTFFTWTLGHAVGEVRWLLAKKMTPALKWLLNAVYYLLPNLEAYNLKDRLYDPLATMGPEHWREVLLYTFAYSAMAFFAGWFALERRQFQ